MRIQYKVLAAVAGVLAACNVFFLLIILEAPLFAALMTGALCGGLIGAGLASYWQRSSSIGGIDA